MARRAEHTGRSLSMAETSQRKGMQQPALTRCRKMLPPGEHVSNIRCWEGTIDLMRCAVRARIVIGWGRVASVVAAVALAVVGLEPNRAVLVSLVG